MITYRSAEPRVCIVILTWNRVDAVISCLISLNSLRYENIDVLVVDNASEDGTVQRLREIFPGLEIIENQRNLGYTGGNNVGIRRALEKGADYVLLLNNDSIVHPSLVNELVTVAESDPSIAVVGPKNMKSDNPRLIWAAWAEVTYGPTLTHIYGLNKLDSMKYAQVKDVEQVIGCGYMWRKEALQDIGLLDTGFFGYHEDVDWCVRARDDGWRVVYVGSAIVYHKGSLSSNPGYSSCIPIMYFLGRNAILFTKKHGDFFKMGLLLCNSLIGSMRRIKRTRLKERLGGELQFWQGICDGFRNHNRQEDFHV
jgi:GT2 family glycosyltransferase